MYEQSGGTAPFAGPAWVVGQEYPQVHEDYNAFLIGFFFILLMGSWILANALIDLAAKRVRVWVVSRWDSHDRHPTAVNDPNISTASRDPRTIG
jgi:hypothetical protein